MTHRAPPILLLVLALVSPAVFAGPTDLVIATTAAEFERTRVLQNALSAQVSDMGATVRLAPVDESDATAADNPAAFGAVVARRTGADALVWMAGDTVFVYAGDEQSRNFFSRALPTGEKSWELTCDAVASMIRTMVFPPEDPSPDATAVGTATAAPGPSAPAAPGPVPVTADRRTSRIRFGAGAGYAPMAMSTRHPFLSGGRLEFDLEVGRFLRFNAGVALLQTARTDGFRLRRLPVSVGVTGQLSAGRWRPGLELSGTLDVTGVPDAERSHETRRVYAAAGLAAAVGLVLIPRLELVARAGVDLYQASNRYLDGAGRTVFDYPPVQGRFFLGVIVWMSEKTFSR